MKNNYIFHTKNGEKSGIANSFDVWLTEDSWILISAFAFNLWYVVLVEVHVENLASHRYVDGEGSILKAFSDNCEYSSLLPL